MVIFFLLHIYILLNLWKHDVRKNKMEAPCGADVLELGVKVTGCVNHAYVEGEDIELPQQEVQIEDTLPKFEATPEERRRLIRNIITLSVAFMFSFMTKYGTGNLQSSLNAAHGLGTASLAAIYSGLVVSNATLPTLILRWFGCKWTMVLCFLLSAPYIGFQYRPTFYSLVPVSLLAGVVAAPMSVAANKYLAVTAQAYTDITGTPMDAVIPKFFGGFLLFCQMSQVWGNLITSLVITTKEPIEVREQMNCGLSYCPSKAVTNPNFRHPEDQTVLILIYIFVGALIVAAILVSGIDSLRRYSDGDHEGNGVTATGFRLLGATFKELAHEKSLQLLLPLTFWLGLEQAFMSADYTAAYVSCSWGLGDVGYVMTTYGLSNALFSLIIGWIVKMTGRVPAIMVAFFSHLTIIVTMVFWHPSPSEKSVFFAITLLWGVADAIWVVQIISLYGALCPGKEEAAFSNYDLWLSLGFIVGFGLSSSTLCTELKVYLLLGFLLLGMMAYLTLEWRQRPQVSPDTSVKDSVK